MKLIAFSGKAQAGKTTSALHAISVFGGTKIALSDAIKEEVGELLTSFGVHFRPENLYGNAEDRAESFRIDSGEWAICADKELQKVLKPFWVITNGGHTISMSFRTLLQAYGTEYRRTQKESYWCEVGRQKILSTDGLIFNDDLRFPDEVEMIKNLGGSVIRIERPGGARITGAEHPSETDLDGYKGFDAHIINAGDVTDLQENVERLLRLVL